MRGRRLAASLLGKSHQQEKLDNSWIVDVVSPPRLLTTLSSSSSSSSLYSIFCSLSFDRMLESLTLSTLEREKDKQVKRLTDLANCGRLPEAMQFGES